MKNRVVILLFLIFYGSCTNDKIKTPPIYLANYPSTQLTQVEFYPSSFIFDTLNTGKEYNGFFYVINKGKKPLIIDSIIKSCNCTSLNIEKRIIASLDTFKYEFKIKPTEHNNYFVSSLMFHMNTKPYYRQYIIEGYSK